MHREQSLQIMPKRFSKVRRADTTCGENAFNASSID